MPIQAATDMRRHPRMRTLKSGSVCFPGSLGIADCTIRDLSLSGARLYFNSTFWLPGKFKQRIETDNIEVACKVVWRTDNVLGVMFIPMPPNLKDSSSGLFQFVR
ncbi:MAG: PilZ domain-containing protein [Hyphomicrobiales bacterium]